MYSIFYYSRHATPTVGFTCQVTGNNYATEGEVIAAQRVLFEGQDTVSNVWTPRLQLSLVDRKALLESEQ
jgi:hypothetical protein